MINKEKVKESKEIGMNQKRIRYRQEDYTLDGYEKELNGWTIARFGCGPTSIATILKNFGYQVNPVDVTKKILINENFEFDKTYLKERGISNQGLIHALNRFIKEDNFSIDYSIIKIDFNNPNTQKDEIVKMFKQGYMAIINVGPSEISPYTFSKNGHYLVISDIDKNENFYVLNSNKTGDTQIGVPYDYETIIKNMYGRKDAFNFLFIKNK